MAKLARISVARSGTSATVTLENFSSGDLWAVYRANKSQGETGQYTRIQQNENTATYTDSPITSGDNYAWRGAMVLGGSQEVWDASTEVWDTSTEVWFQDDVQQKSTPKYSNP